MERSDRRAAAVGDIVAMHTPGLLPTGETIRAPGSVDELEPQTFSTPVLVRAVEPQSESDLAELADRARALAAEDPTLEVAVDPERGGILVRGMGELHLEVFAERLKRELSAPPRFGRPAVVCRETVVGTAVGEAECTRALGGRTIRARARVRVEPLADTDRPRFRWAVPENDAGEALRGELLQGLASRAEGGFASAHAVGGIAVEIVEVREEGEPDMVRPLLHEAIALACRRAVQGGGIRITEPWCRLEAVVPVDATGAVLADLQSRGARIQEVGGEVLESRIRGRVPLGRVLGYATELRSMTRGRGRFELTPDGFDAA